jgi:hypothetical protein
MNQAAEIPGKMQGEEENIKFTQNSHGNSKHNSVLVDNLPDCWANKEGSERFSFFCGWVERWWRAHGA